MGTWSVEPFGNDDAADWANELENVDDLGPIEMAIDTVLETGDEYLEAPDAAVAVAAIDTLARLNGSPGESSSYTEVADAWAERMSAQPTPDLIDRALSAIDRILGDHSELRELWEESEDFEGWRASMESLRARVAV